MLGSVEYSYDDYLKRFRITYSHEILNILKENYFRPFQFHWITEEQLLTKDEYHRQIELKPLLNFPN